jgi:hypothetical protein
MMTAKIVAKTLTAIISFIAIAFSSSAIAESIQPPFVNHIKYGDLSDKEKLAYTKGALESIMFTLYSRNLSNTHDYNIMVKCYKKNYSKLSLMAHTPWLFGRDLDKSLAYNILNLNTPTLCANQKASDHKLGNKTLRLTYFTEWGSWTKTQKINYVGGYIDGSVAILMSFSDAESRRLLNEVQKLNLSEENLWRIVQNIEANGFELNLPIPWSVSVAFGQAFGKSEKQKTKNNEEIMKNRLGEVSLSAYSTFVDFKIITEVCKPHFNSNLDPKKQRAISDYIESLKCHGEKSVDGFIKPILISFGVPSKNVQELIEPLLSSYDYKLENTSIAYNQMVGVAARELCLSLLDDHEFSDFVLAEKIDAMKYQSERVKSAKDIFNRYLKEAESCPKIFSLENSVTAPNFLVK